MRRTFAAALVALSTAVTVLPAISTSAATPTASTASTARASAADPAREALRTARQILGSPERNRGGSARPDARPDASLALRDLFVVRPELEGDDREIADALLARPTDGASDPYAHGYTVPSKRKCKQNVCIHWVPTTADAPPSGKWVVKNLATMNRVWKFEVDKMGYRRPPRDPGDGGNRRFDVYLKELGNLGVYGYCAPEYKVRGTKRGGTSFCVLDNDFARSQFNAPPGETLRVTAAHEFFHAIQFGYDYDEDRWLFESTATWMEERYADRVDDNRQFLPNGQVGLPGIPLDMFNPSGLSSHYGNWAFWEYVTRRYGNALVKDVWTRAAGFDRARNLYSTKALKAALKKHGGFAAIFRKYAAANAIPGRTYPEGKKWPRAQLAGVFTMSKGSRRAGAETRIDHMAANHMLFRPDRTLKGKRWKLRVVVDAPGPRAGGAAYLIVKNRKGGWTSKPIALNRKGKGSAKFSFSRRTVKSAIVTLVNTSTAFRCWRDNPNFSCDGDPKGDDRLFVIRGRVVKR